MEHSKGYRTRSRKTLRRTVSDRKTSQIGSILKEFKNGDKVTVKVNSSVHKGMPHVRYQGKIGEVIKKRGKSYEVQINDLNKSKLIVSPAVHLRKVN